MKHQKTATRAKPSTRDGIPIASLEQIQELVLNTWADASNLPTQWGVAELCTHLPRAAEVLDLMIERRNRKRSPKKLRRQP